MQDSTIDQAPSTNIAMPQLASDYSVEFFHIYTDEKIEDRHINGLESMQALQPAWKFEYNKIILIDNYNPVEHVISAEEILDFLESQNMMPDYWAYEADMVANAQKFLAVMPESKLKRSYLRYIEQHGKYPCSLLTATWYLTRLGHLDTSPIKQAHSNAKPYQPARRLFNLLPKDYRPIEKRADELILNSLYAAESDRIQDWFYPVEAGRALELF